jgi:mannose-1-phosphate guanylyltransferase
VLNQPQEKLIPVIMAGGAGVRFWPLGTEDLPKQFLTVFSSRSLYRQSVERARALAPIGRILVMTNEKFADLVREQSPELPPENIILEPCRRDTAPAVALAAVLIEKRWPDSCMVVLPSDHLVRDGDGFRTTILAAAAKALEGGLVTIGVPPAYPATGYGYLFLQERTVRAGQAVRLRAFIEKPDRARAEAFLADGRYLWNAGMFVWRTSVILEAVRRHLPEIHDALAPLGALIGRPDFASGVRRAFDPLRPISIDYGVMEKAEQVWAVPAGFDWSDVGSWKSLMDLLPQDSEGNRVIGRVTVDAAGNNLLITTVEGRPMLCSGIQDCVVVHTQEGVLVCHRDRAEVLKPLVETILREKEMQLDSPGGTGCADAEPGEP